MATATLERTAPKEAPVAKDPAKARTARAPRTRKAPMPEPLTKAPATAAGKPKPSPTPRAKAKPKAKASKPKSMHNKELGARGEEAAARFLAHRGYEILERNWTCAAGEADIIARDEGCLVFVEVKTRSDCAMGFPSEAVTAKKRERYERIACLYLEQHEVAEVLVRFDVVSIVAIAPDRALVRHHINAWSEAGK